MRYFAGIDVAKDIHWLCVIDDNAEVVIDHALPNTQEDIDAACTELHALEGELVIGLDVMGSIAAFIEAALISKGYQPCPPPRHRRQSGARWLHKRRDKIGSQRRQGHRRADPHPQEPADCCLR